MNEIVYERNLPLYYEVLKFNKVYWLGVLVPSRWYSIRWFNDLTRAF